MKKRNRSRRQSANKGRGIWIDPLLGRTKRRRRAWTFEQLEARYYFTATPLAGLEVMQSVGISNSTPEGQQLLDAIELMWAAQSSSNTSGGQSQGGAGSDQSEIQRLVPYSIPTDPYLTYQWHLFNVGQVVNPGQFQDLFGVPGQDINVIPAWDQGYTGAGVNVAVVDTGVQLNHPDLVDNLANGYDAIRDRPGGGPQGDDPHGTAVAGLIGASANNGIGGTGIAFGATIVPIRFLGLGSNEQTYLNAVGANGTPIDIYNNSWGPSFDFYGRAVAGPTVTELIALTNSAQAKPGGGRNGLGAIHVFAAGNSAEDYHSAGSNGWVNSRYTIAVGVVDHDGKVPNSDGTSTEYGEMSPSVLIVAPTASGPIDIINNFATGSGLFTTDQNPGGYNVPPLPSGVNLDIDAFPDPLYTSRFGGTSGAAPMVSGVIALMLEANPNLTYRDVEEILVRSARQNDDLDESWITNLVPLFRDPSPHNPFPDNYPNMAPMTQPVYPNDEDQWNDEIVYQLVPGTPMSPAVHATTGMVQASNSKFSVTARADKPWDGWVANNLTVTFRTEPGDIPGAVAQIVEGKIRVTVTGDGVTWGEIGDAINFLGQNPLNPDPMDAWFDVTVSNASGVFDPFDELIQAPLSGGIDATGRESTLVRNPQYQGYHPIADPITNPEPLSLFTNGAGFTVSHGRDTSEYGYAHGVVDAALAVDLAKQWHLKDQNLPAEKTWLASRDISIPIRGAQVTDEMSGEYVIPGALSYSTDGFAEYFNEFFKEPTIKAGEDGDPMAMPPVPATPDTIEPMSLPFNQDDPPVNTRGNFLTFDVPAIDPVTGASNLMSMEWAEVHLNITGDADAMNYLRITLVSPDGTHSELTQNHYRPDDVQHNFQEMATGGILVGLPDSITPIDDMGNQSDTLDWVYSTNRIWGERSDSKPVFDENGNLIDLKGWELHFENYSGSDLQLNGTQIAFHGSPIGSPAGPVERVMGKVGVDSGRFIQAQNQIVGANDGEFNFDRFVTTTSNDSHALTTTSAPFGASNTPFGAHEIRVADPLQEQFAGNITVYAIDTSTGQRVAQFVTGYDGNYYFDLPDGNYTIGVEDPLGRMALANGTNYDDQWTITVDTSDFFTRTSGEIDPISGKVNFFDDLDFLLDPGSIPSGEVVFTGQVIGDLDGDGTQDAVDTGVYNVNVYADLNHTGQFDIGEPFTLTDVDGKYELHVPTGTPNTFSIGIKPPGSWTVTTPVTQFHLEYSLPGEQTDDIDFLIKPPATPSGQGNAYIFGFIYKDLNGDGVQQEFEEGLPGRTVFIDANQNGDFDPGEISTLTDSKGAYQFGEVIVGTVRIDTVVEEPYVLTSPLVPGNEDGYIQLTLVAGQVSTGNDFGVENLAVNDFGDLVGGFNPVGEDVASNFAVPGFSLGATIDAEVRSRSLVETPPGSHNFVADPNLNGIGDDQVDPLDDTIFDDEDGVVLAGGLLRRGSNALQVTVQGVGGYLQGWIDFDQSGTFESGERIFDEDGLDLNPGTYQLAVIAPQTLENGHVAARFRWGTIGQNYFGHDIIGEVEDYLFEAKIVFAPGDFNGDEMVDGDDFDVWKETYGSTVDLRADGNHDGVVNSADYTIWRNHNGSSGGGGGAGISPSLPASLGAGSTGAAGGVDDDLSSSPVDSSELAAPSFDLAGFNQSTMIMLASPVGRVSHSSATAADHVDSAMLLLTLSDASYADSDRSDGAFGEEVDWMNDSERDDTAFDLALASAFEDKADWWKSL